MRTARVVLFFEVLACLPYVHAAEVQKARARLAEQHRFQGKGIAQQGVALSEQYYYSSSATTICRFDTRWNLLEKKTLILEGVNHLGAIHYHKGYIWGGFLHGPEGGKHDPELNQAIVAKIRAKDLKPVLTWDITSDVNWIDPVCFDGTHLWVGDMSDLGIHRYRITNGNLVRDGIFRHPKAMSFSQGIRIVGKKLYSIHTFGSMDGLFEFDISEKLTGTVKQPIRVWDIKQTRMHLEGFDFIPGRPNSIWHAQGDQVDRYILEGLHPRRATP